MKRSMWVGLIVGMAISGGAFLWVVNGMGDSKSVRVGTWAQIIGALGAVAAAWLALRTAESNRDQAKEANQALATATRPQLTVDLTPDWVSTGHAHAECYMALRIDNFSSFDVPKGRVHWFLRDGTTGQKELGLLPAMPHDKPHPLAGAVLNFGDEPRRTHFFVDLSKHKAWQAGTDRIVLYYLSPFGNGGWMEQHYWTTWDQGENRGVPDWKIRHTADAPKWATLGSMGF